MTGDPAIRAALLPAIRASRPGALLVQEWGVGYGRDFFADVAAIGATLTEAWEIKSDADSLARLRRQVPLYGAAFDRCTLVAAPRHTDRALALLPAWWGVIVYDAGALRVQREPQANAGARPERLLWAGELQALVRSLGRWRDAVAARRVAHAAWLAGLPPHVDPAVRAAAAAWQRANPPRRPQRADLVAAIAGVPRAELAPLVCAALRARPDWRRPDGYRVERRT